MGDGESHLHPEVLRSLSAHRRRNVLDFLLNAEAEQVAFDALVDHVVEEETSSPPPDREAVASSLHHSHLPKLAEEGLVVYPEAHGSATTTAKTELAEPLLEVARNWESEPDA